MNVTSGVAGLLILQLAVIASGQQVAPPASPYWRSAPPAVALAGESSQSQGGTAAAKVAREAITQSGKAGGSGDSALGGERHPLYRLSKSDTVEVIFTFSPDFNQSLAIQPDGYIVLRGAGPLYAEGLTITELQQAIGAAYRGVLHDPEITVLRNQGMTEEAILAAIRLAAVVHGIATVLDTESVGDRHPVSV